MKIRILTSHDGFPCGSEVDVPDATAQAWIALGDAEAIGPPADEQLARARRTKRSAETAAADAVETR